MIIQPDLSQKKFKKIKRYILCNFLNLEANLLDQNVNELEFELSSMQMK